MRATAILLATAALCVESCKDDCVPDDCGGEADVVALCTTTEGLCDLGGHPLACSREVAYVNMAPGSCQLEVIPKDGPLRIDYQLLRSRLGARNDLRFGNGFGLRSEDHNDQLGTVIEIDGTPLDCERGPQAVLCSDPPPAGQTLSIRHRVANLRFVTLTAVDTQCRARARVCPE